MSAVNMQHIMLDGFIARAVEMHKFWWSRLPCSSHMYSKDATKSIYFSNEYRTKLQLLQL